MRNPAWTRDELILALALYIEADRKQLAGSDPRVIELSGTLQQLPIHPIGERTSDFRNSEGVSMKLGNFLAIDPTYSGKGLERGSKLDQVVWDEFSVNWDILKKVAEAIRIIATDTTLVTKISTYLDSDEEFWEGTILTRLHNIRERDPDLVASKKKHVLKQTGKLACEVCEFDFAEMYGDIGHEFAECHHKLPLSQMERGMKVKLNDLAIVCANCHRMLHRGRQLLSMDELRVIVSNRRIARQND